jgi:hypothetical protein
MESGLKGVAESGLASVSGACVRSGLKSPLGGLLAIWFAVTATVAVGKWFEKGDRNMVSVLELGK